MPISFRSAFCYEEECPLDEQSQKFLEKINSASTPPMETQPVEKVRQEVQKIILQSSIKLKSIQDKKIATPVGIISIRIYIPDGQGPFSVFITFHGGGWVLGSLDMHDPFCRDISFQAKAVVVSVDYPLAPEHKFPKAIHASYMITEWVAKNIQEFEGDPYQIVISGNSAGGNLATVVALMAKEKKFPIFQAQVLIYPVTQYRFDTSSYNKYAEGYFLTKKQMQWFWSLYLNQEEEGNQPYASPLLAKDLFNLPSTLIVLAKFDPLYDEGVEYGKKLQSFGVPVTLLTYPTMHIFISMADQLEIGKKAIKDIVKFLNELS